MKSVTVIHVRIRPWAYDNYLPYHNLMIRTGTIKQWKEFDSFGTLLYINICDLKMGISLPNCVY